MVVSSGICKPSSRTHSCRHGARGKVTQLVQLQFADEIPPVCAAAWPQCGFLDGDSNRLLGGNVVPVTIDTQSCRVVSASGRSVLGRSRPHCWREETLRMLRAPCCAGVGTEGAQGTRMGGWHSRPGSHGRTNVLVTCDGPFGKVFGGKMQAGKEWDLADSRAALAYSLRVDWL